MFSRTLLDGLITIFSDLIQLGWLPRARSPTRIRRRLRLRRILHHFLMETPIRTIIRDRVGPSFHHLKAMKSTEQALMVATVVMQNQQKSHRRAATIMISSLMEIKILLLLPARPPARIAKITISFTSNSR